MFEVGYCGGILLSGIWQPKHEAFEQTIQKTLPQIRREANIRPRYWGKSKIQYCIDIYKQASGFVDPNDLYFDTIELSVASSK
nr:hypothetical protein A132_20245 [Vibrio kanaloae 5S-149]